MFNRLDETLEVAVRTDPGKVRDHNEDAVFANPRQGVAILADGMGGYNGGEVASGMATMLLSDALARALDDAPDGEFRPYAHRCLLEEVAQANEAIYNAANAQPKYAGMGTTLVVVLFYDNRIAVAHIGDSRLYRLRGGEFSAMTRDHSLLQEQIDSGMITVEEARFSQNRNLVTRALGVEFHVETELDDYPVQVGDIYLLCSDGLNDMVEDEDIRSTLMALSGDLELAATRLVQMANDKGGRDNVSVILVKVLRDFQAGGSWRTPFRRFFGKGR